MNRKFFYGCRIIYNLFRVPLLKLVYFSSIQLPIKQNMSPAVRLRAFNGGHIVITSRITAEDGVLIEANRGVISIAGCFINRNTTIVSMERIEIKKGATIGPGVAIYDHDHALNCTRSSEPNFVTAPVIIGEKAWIGANATILKGVTIGCNAVVAAGAVVKGNVEDNSIVAGVPARKIGMRG